MCRRENSTFRGAPSERDGQIQQLGRGRGRASAARHIGGLVEGHQGQLVAVSGSHGEVPGSDLRLVDDLSEPAMHRPAPSGCHIGVETPGQQRVCETKSVPVDNHDAFPLDVFELCDDILGGHPGGRRYQLDRRCGVTCHREQHVARGLVRGRRSGHAQAR